MMLLMMHQPQLHQPWRLDACSPCIHMFILKPSRGERYAVCSWCLHNTDVVWQVAVLVLRAFYHGLPIDMLDMLPVQQ